MTRLGDLIKPAKVIRCGTNQYPVLSMTMHDGIMLQSDRFKKSLASADQSDYKVVNYGQLAVGFPIDEGVLYIQRVVPTGIMSPAYSVWDVNYDIVDPLYLELSLHSPQAMQYYKENLRGTTARRRSIPTDTLLALPLRLPSLEEQRKIAAVLDKVSDLIAKRRQQLDKLDEIVKARFVEMFGDPMSNPYCWNLKGLLQLGDCKNGMNFHSTDVGVNIHCLGVGDFKNLSRISDTSKLPTISLTDMPSDEYMLKDGDIVFVRSNGNKALVGRSLAVYPATIPTTFSGFCIRFRLHSDEVKADYLLRVLKTDSIRKKMAGRGANIQNLNQKILGELQIPVPPLELQNQFSVFVEQTDKIKNTIGNSLEKLEVLKKALMQEYFYDKNRL